LAEVVSGKMNISGHPAMPMALLIGQNYPFFGNPENMTAGMDNRALLGELFYKAGLLKIDQLCQVLCIAHKNSLPTGRVLVMMGHCRQKTMEAGLTLQNLIRQNVLAYDLAVQALQEVAVNKTTVAVALQELGWEGDAYRDQDNLGTILIEAGILTQKSIEDAHGLSRHVGLPLNRVLVLQGLLSPHLLAAALSAQALIRSGRTDRAEAISALNATSLSLNTNSSCDIALLNTPEPYLRLDELLLLSGLLMDNDLKIYYAKQEKEGNSQTLGQYIVESGIFSASLIASAVRLQTMTAKHEVTPDRAARALKLVFARDISLTKALKELSRESDPYDGGITLYHLLRLSGLVTAYDIRRLGHLPVHTGVGQDPLEERLLKTGIINHSALDASKRCLLLTREGFLTAEQAMIVLHHWSWSGDGLTKVLEKLQWADGRRMPSLKALAFSG